MMKSILTDQEISYIKSHKAIPRSVLQKEMDLIMNNILDMNDSELEVSRKVAKWIRDWLSVIDHMSESAKDTSKPSSFV